VRSGSGGPQWKATSKGELLAWFHDQVTAVTWSMRIDELSPPIEQARRFIEEHYAEPVTLDRLAALKAAVGPTPVSYKTAVRKLAR